MQSFITEQIWIISASDLLFKNKSITMHGNVNVKSLDLLSPLHSFCDPTCCMLCIQSHRLQIQTSSFALRSLGFLLYQNDFAKVKFIANAYCILLFLLRFIMVAAQNSRLSCCTLKSSPAVTVTQAVGKWEMQKLQTVSTWTTILGTCSLLSCSAVFAFISNIAHNAS